MAKGSRAAALEGAEVLTASAAQHRERILKAAMNLLTARGRDALTTRGVAEAARVQPPILYRLFHDKESLLNAVAEYGFSAYMARKRPPVNQQDPVEGLRAGWRLHVQFGLANPELYLLMYADPRPGKEGRAAQQAHRMLRKHMRHVAIAGRLRLSEEHAAQLFHAVACGTVMTLLGMTNEEREEWLSNAACETALAAILTDQPIAPAQSITTAAITLGSLLTDAETTHRPESKVLTEAERALLIEWLGRLAKPDSCP